jgi:hypothetical protein
MLRTCLFSTSRKPPALLGRFTLLRSPSPGVGFLAFSLTLPLDCHLHAALWCHRSRSRVYLEDRVVFLLGLVCDGSERTAEGSRAACRVG